MPAEILRLAMNNREVDTRLFTDEQEAVTWLTNSCCQSCLDHKNDSCLVYGDTLYDYLSRTDQTD